MTAGAEAAEFLPTWTGSHVEDGLTSPTQPADADASLLRACRGYLTWQDPSRPPVDGLRLDRQGHLVLAARRISVHVQRFDRTATEGRGGEEERFGAFRPAFLAAQLHWAAAVLAPLHSDFARVRRELRENYKVRWRMRRLHPYLWTEWEKSRDGFMAVDAMREHVAGLMVAGILLDPIR